MKKRKKAERATTVALREARAWLRVCDGTTTSHELHDILKATVSAFAKAVVADARRTRRGKWRTRPAPAAQAAQGEQGE